MIISNAIHYIVTLTPVVAAATVFTSAAAVPKMCDICELNDSKIPVANRYK